MSKKASGIMKQLILIPLAIIINCLIIEGQTIDETFNQPIPIRPAKVYSLKVIAGNRLLLGGDLSYFESERVNNLIRLNSDNTLDESFKFSADKHFKIRRVEYLSTGDIVVLANYEKETDVTTDSCILFRLGPEGEVKNRIDTLINCVSFAIQNDDKILVVRSSFSHPGLTRHLYRYNGDFSSDIAFNNRVTTNDLIWDVKVYNSSIYICGSFSMVNDTVKNGIAKLNINGSIDTTFSIGSGTNDPIRSMTIQPDGKILLGETAINIFNGKQYFGMIRLNDDGTADSGFKPPALNSPSSQITYKDSSIYLAVSTPLEGPILLKLNYDGSIDSHYKKVKLDNLSFRDFRLGFSGDTVIFNNLTTTGNKYGISACDSAGNYLGSFAPAISRFGEITMGYYLNEKLLIAGDFMKVNDIETFGIAMLDKNGNIDNKFVLPKNLGSVKQLQILNDTTIFVSTYDSFLKLNEKGSILQGFDFKKFTKLYEILKFKALDDGKILAADANIICRLNSDGMPDLTFNTGTGINTSCTGLDFDLQEDKIIWGSAFTNFNGTNVHKLIRLNNDGSLDSVFNIGIGPDADGQVFITKVLNSGDIIAGGWFNRFSGFDTPHMIVKLSKDGVIDTTFIKNQNSSSLSWQTSPYTTKIEQTDSVIFVKNRTSITCLNQDGTVNTDFNIPAIIGNVNDIITGNENQNVPVGRKSSSVSKSNTSLFVLGSFKRSANGDPLFIIKLNLDSKNSLPALSTSSTNIHLKAAENSSSTFDILSNIYWDVSSNQNWLSVSIGSGSNNETVTVTASANTGIFQRTAIVTISGSGIPSQTVVVIQASALTSVPEIENCIIKLWPIPVKDKLHFSFSGTNTPRSIEIFFSNGMKIYSSQLNSDNSEIDMTNFATGLYYIKLISADKKVIIRKILKQ
jgi:uncharacterized delta-60 repeat protein